MNLPNIESLKRLDKRLLLIPLGGIVVYASTRSNLSPDQKLKAYNAETKRQTELARIQKQPELENIRLTAKVALDNSKRKESTDIAVANSQAKSVRELAKIDATSQKYSADANVSISKLMYASQNEATNKQYLLGKYLADSSSNTAKYQTDRAYWIKQKELSNQKSKDDKDFWGGLVSDVFSFF